MGPFRKLVASGKQIVVSVADIGYEAAGQLPDMTVETSRMVKSGLRASTNVLHVLANEAEILEYRSAQWKDESDERLISILLNEDKEQKEE